MFVVNATPIPRYAYRLGAIDEGFYEEILNTDAETYGGSNVGNLGGVHADAIPWQGQNHSISINLPPLGVVAFKKHPY
jgi:1,4-alpha-glucan branching enzyme